MTPVRLAQLTKGKAIAILVLVVGSTLAGISYARFVQSPCGKGGEPILTMNGGLDAAAGYLKSHFNSDLGLLYESESGERSVAGRTYNLSQWYWLYSDNLLASWALKPYDLSLSSTINASIQAYHLPPNRFFDVLFGHPIPTDDEGPNNLVIRKTDSYVVMAEVHNSTTAIGWQNYANSLIYQALNQFLRGDMTAADQDFCRAYRMFNGVGVADLALFTEGYATYKLALILYASRVLNIVIPTIPQIESRLWSMQASDGGTITLSDVLGHRGSSANTETTSIALLPYDDQLVMRMRLLFGCEADLRC